jgi:hypothetical protein
VIVLIRTTKNTSMKKLFILLATALTFMATAYAEIGSLSSDLVYTPITPCRILDTRLFGGGAGTPIPAATTYSYAVGGLTSYATLGGSATDCGLLTPGLNIAALAINFVVVSPSAAGYITAFPYLAARPTASTVNYTAGEVVANSAVVKVSQSSSTWMSVYSLATTHLVADVSGYYSKPVATALECMETAQTQVTILAGAINAAIAPGCPVGYTTVVILCDASSFDLPLRTGGTGDGCTSKNNTAVSQTIFASRRCCRIPGR